MPHEKIAPSTSGPKSSKFHGYDMWEVRNALESIQRAQGILDDAKLLKAVVAYAKEERKELGDVIKKGLRSLTK